MSTLYSYSLLPVVAVSALLFFTVALRLRGPVGLAAYCGAITFWSFNLLLAHSPSSTLAEWALRMAASGTFVVAGYLHAAFDLTGQKRYGLVYLAYFIAVAITGAGYAFPGLLYDPLSLAAGPFFWPSMILAIGAALVPMGLLFWQYHRSDGPDAHRRRLGGLLAVGVLGYSGAWLNAAFLAHGHLLPYGLFLVLTSLLLLAIVVQSMQSRADRKLFERSLIYSALAALLSAGFLFGALVFLADATTPVLRDYGLSALFLFAMAALGLEPVRQFAQEYLGRKIAGEKLQASQVVDALVQQEARADQAERLAMVGTFTSAIAHEIRNPLGVLTAYLRILERQGTDPEILDEMRAEIDRASHFLDDLLLFGRPRKLELRDLLLLDTIELAISSVTAARHDILPPDLSLDLLDSDPALEVLADQGQLSQMLIILLENALLATLETDHPRIEIRAWTDPTHFFITIDDNGPGIDPALQDTLFEPFVTGRKREGPVHGTGLGLAIAQNIATRHQGTLTVDSSPLGGARFLFQAPLAD